jgi:HPt (histidine-containing phosphotransfer) domain-containing protein
LKLPDDPVVRELLPEFIDSWINDIDEQFDALIANKDADNLYRLAHTIKGSCFQFGLDHIAELGIKLMDEAKTKNWQKAVTYKKPIRNYFIEAKEYLEKNS